MTETKFHLKRLDPTTNTITALEKDAGWSVIGIRWSFGLDRVWTVQFDIASNLNAFDMDDLISDERIGDKFILYDNENVPIWMGRLVRPRNASIQPMVEIKGKIITVQLEDHSAELAGHPGNRTWSFETEILSRAGGNIVLRDCFNWPTNALTKTWAFFKEGTQEIVMPCLGMCSWNEEDNEFTYDVIKADVAIGHDRSRGVLFKKVSGATYLSHAWLFFVLPFRKRTTINSAQLNVTVVNEVVGDTTLQVNIRRCDVIPLFHMPGEGDTPELITDSADQFNEVITVEDENTGIDYQQYSFENSNLVNMINDYIDKSEYVQGTLFAIRMATRDVAGSDDNRALYVTMQLSNVDLIKTLSTLIIDTWRVRDPDGPAVILGKNTGTNIRVRYTSPLTESAYFIKAFQFNVVGSYIPTGSTGAEPDIPAAGLPPFQRTRVKIVPTVVKVMEGDGGLAVTGLWKTGILKNGEICSHLLQLDHSVNNCSVPFDVTDGETVLSELQRWRDSNWEYRDVPDDWETGITAGDWNASGPPYYVPTLKNWADAGNVELGLRDRLFLEMWIPHTPLVANYERILPTAGNNDRVEMQMYLDLETVSTIGFVSVLWGTYSFVRFDWVNKNVFIGYNTGGGDVGNTYPFKLFKRNRYSVLLVYDATHSEIDVYINGLLIGSGPIAGGDTIKNLTFTGTFTNTAVQPAYLYIGALDGNQFDPDYVPWRQYVPTRWHWYPKFRTDQHDPLGSSGASPRNATDVTNLKLGGLVLAPRLALFDNGLSVIDGTKIGGAKVVHAKLFAPVTGVCLIGRDGETYLAQSPYMRPDHVKSWITMQDGDIETPEDGEKKANNVAYEYGTMNQFLKVELLYRHSPRSGVKWGDLQIGHRVRVDLGNLVNATLDHSAEMIVQDIEGQAMPDGDASMVVTLVPFH